VRRRAGSFALHAALLLWGAVTLVPLLWMVSASLMPSGQSLGLPPRFLPHPATIIHYRELFTRLNIGRYLANSAILATSVTLASVLFNSMAGYAFAKLRFPGRRRLLALLVALMLVPAQIAMLPLFLLLKVLGLVNTLGGVIVPAMASVFGILLVRQYAQSLSDDLLDAARIEGAGEFRIYWSIVLPLCRPVLVTLAVFTFLATWNDFLWPLIVLTGDAHYTLPVALANLAGEHVQDTELMMAGSVLTILPVLVLFLAVQRYYLDGITLGSVKG